jgi:hypothetical protein
LAVRASIALCATFPKQGAALQVASVVGIPTEFSLFIQSEHFNRKCRVVWRKSNRIGVKFEQGVD